MPQMQVVLEGDQSFVEQQAKFGPNFHFIEDPTLRVARLAKGTKEGNSIVAIGFEHEGKYIVLQTTLKLFKAASDAMVTRDELEDSSPTSLEEYNAKFYRNQRVTGEGLDVTMHIPCPFCSAAEFAVYKLLESKVEMQKENTCKECGRSAKVVLSGDNQETLEVVQTGGNPPPAWLPPIRRCGP